ncbi:hypothetical protein [Pyruvatibacter mobilis]|uniref:hypothetical protein n=1 Tax=Pyruvatibacter mobilis TaxID=1712261 RepID=UPI003BABF8F6
MLECSRGLQIATDVPQAVAAIDGFTHALIAHTDTALVVLDAPEADPECVEANAAAAALMMFGETRHSASEARPFIDEAFTHIGKATPREDMFARAVGAWVSGDIPLALRYHAAILEQWPADILNIKIAQHHCFNRGDAAGIRWFGETGHRHDPDCAYLEGMYAFGLEQAGDLDGAERAARAACERLPRNPWAHHALAHVLFTRQQHLQALAFLHRESHHWDDCSSFMYTHNWWHTALAALGTGCAEDALELYDAYVWTRDINQIQPQVNAASLLARLELQGVDVGTRWEPVARKARTHIHDHVNGYLDLHFLLALAGAGQDARALSMLASLEDHAARRLNEGDLTWRYVILPAARGILAHRHGDMQTAAINLETALPGLHLAGGSHAQRALFADMLTHAREHARIQAA